MSMMHVNVHAPCLCPCMCVCMCVCVCTNAGMLDCPASNKSGSRMKKSNDAGTGPVPDQDNEVWHFFSLVPDWHYECQNADASVSWSNADAQQCLNVKSVWKAVMGEQSKLENVTGTMKTVESLGVILRYLCEIFWSTFQNGFRLSSESYWNRGGKSLEWIFNLSTYLPIFVVYHSDLSCWYWSCSFVIGKILK
jgi:hypothetical protein